MKIMRNIKKVWLKKASKIILPIAKTAAITLSLGKTAIAMAAFRNKTAIAMAAFRNKTAITMAAFPNKTAIAAAALWSKKTD